jgi:hypothetical protein
MTVCRSTMQVEMFEVGREEDVEQPPFETIEAAEGKERTAVAHPALNRHGAQDALDQEVYSIEAQHRHDGLQQQNSSMA